MTRAATDATVTEFPSDREAVTDDEEVSVYDAFRPQGVRRMRDLPSLTWRAFVLTWDAARLQLSALMGVQVISGLGTALQLLIGAKVVSAILRAQQDKLGLHAVLPSLILLVAITAGLSFLDQIRTELQRLLGELVTRQALSQIIDVATAVDYDAYERPGFFDRMQRAQVAASGRAVNLVVGVTTLFGAIVGVLGLVVGLVALAPMLVPFVIFGYLPLWVASCRNSRATYQFGWNMTPLDRRRFYYSDLLTGKASAQEVRVFGLAGHIRQRYEQLYDERIAEMVNVTKQRLRRSLFASFLASFLGAGAFVALLALLLTGHVATAAALPAAVGLQQLASRLNGVAVGASLIYENSLFLADLGSFFELVPAIEAARAREVAPAGFQRLQVDGLSFAYPGARGLALDDVSLEINAGEVVALVGENGSGKTTLAKLLCSLYQPGSGQILWDGRDIGACDPDTVRRNIACVFQDFVRYNLPLHENVTLGDTTRAFDLDNVERACREAGADGFVSKLPMRYETQLGRMFESGTDLSVGQWQRIALARAFYRDAPFVVLDEPTSALDAAAEYELFERIKRMAEGRTVVMISHRFSTVRSADRIVVLHHGRVVEQGNHNKLMAARGRYFHMYSLQASAFAASAA